MSQSAKIASDVHLLVSNPSKLPSKAPTMVPSTMPFVTPSATPTNQAPAISTPKALSAKPTISPTVNLCDAQQQVHITFGDDSQSVVISFVSSTNGTSTPTLSRVIYATSKTGCDGQGQGGSVLPSKPSYSTATGSKTVYSQLQFVSPNSLYNNPVTGYPYTTEQAVANLENTSTWAYSWSADGKTKDEWFNYVLTTLPLDNKDINLLSYKNNYLIYDSPYIHTVTISGLTQGQKYYYKPDKSCKTFSFTIPKAASYPITFGLTADLGITPVSSATVSALIAMKPAAILFPGDLVYADGWGPMWDTYAQFTERLAANTPMLYTG